MISFELVKALDSFLNSTAFEGNITDWNELISISKKQSVAGMVYPLIEKLPEEKRPSRELCGSLEGQYFQTVTLMANYEFIKEKIANAFEKKQIKCVFFKGIVIKDSYPIPELRTMSDIDFLILEEDREIAHKTLCELGAKCTKNTEPVYMYNLSGVTLEVHTKFAEDIEEEKEKASKLYEDIWDNTEKLNNFEYIFVPTPQFHILMLLIHTYRHFTGVGCGLRLFIDSSIFYEKYKSEIDVNKLKADIDKIELTDFAKLSFYLNNRWFGFENIYEFSLDEETYKEVTDYIMQSGTFGFEISSVAQKAVRMSLKDKRGMSKSTAKFGYFIKKVFPPFSRMKNEYAFVRKCPILLPIGWVANIYNQLTKRGKYVTDYTKDLFSKDSEAEKIYNLFDKLGL